MHHEVKPAVNQIETHPFYQQAGAQTFLQENGVQMESWGPFAEGKNDLFHNALLQSIGEKHGKSVAQAVVRGLTQRGVVAIPKSVRKERMAENLAVYARSSQLPRHRGGPGRNLSVERLSCDIARPCRAARPRGGRHG